MQIPDLASIIYRHEDHQRSLYRNYLDLSRDDVAKAQFVQSINELLRDLRHRYTTIGDDSQRALLYTFAQTWRVNLTTMLSTDPTEPLPLPPPSSSPLAKPLTEPKLREQIVYLAQRIANDHAMFHPNIGADQNRDWHDAEVYLAMDVLDGHLPFDAALRAESYWRLENIWLSEIVQLRAYHEWEKRGRHIDLIGDKSDYLAECAGCTLLLVNPLLKAAPTLFQHPKDYISNKYLQAPGEHIDIYHHVVRRELIDPKIRKVRDKAPNALDSAVEAHVVDYVARYYDNIIPAIEHNRQAAESVLTAFHLSQNDRSESSIINAFEAAIPIYFMNSDLIKELWQTPVPRIGTF